MKKLFYAALAIVFLASSFIYGVEVGKREWFPHDLIKQLKYLALNSSDVRFDNFNRLVESSRHTEIPCPSQNKKTGVLVAFGQSNSANHAEYKFSEDELDGVINYFNGRCYSAQSPLLGATGADGEWISLTAKKLIEAGVYEEVIVVSSGIGGTPVMRWADGNDLNNMFKDVLQALLKEYRVTDLVWHQGESDRVYTHTDVYETYFMSMVNSVRDIGIDAPIFVSIASICGEEGSWLYPNRVTAAQTRLSDNEGLELGVNTDEVVPIELRYDKCHFGKVGQELAASALAGNIVEFHATNR